ncbi:uncharacterized protein LOC108831215 [Raphanus sativus]|uniref:Uncharacterized protein LOC108831215 n=1 Tax=Raphanus sativus TaxID=3726 RepID=A0A9W3CNL1_RAPSA|nr:uncharacterized protein LOC108831215 [Raphanus sativus]
MADIFLAMVVLRDLHPDRSIDERHIDPRICEKILLITIVLSTGVLLLRPAPPALSLAPPATPSFPANSQALVQGGPFRFLVKKRNLRIQDYKSVEEYNSVMFKIVSKLKLCGETITDADMLEKTFSTFHTSNMLLQQQYREKGFSTYVALISCLLLSEQNNELLMMNSELTPPGAKALPEAHAAIEPKDETPRESYRGRMRDRGRWQGSNRGFQPRGRGFQPRGRGFQPRDHLGPSRGRGYSRGHQASRGYKSDFKIHGSTKSPCYLCGMTNHWANRCKTPQHLVKLYQESMKGKNPMANWVQHDNENDLDHENDDRLGFETSDCLKEAN